MAARSKTGYYVQQTLWVRTPASMMLVVQDDHIRVGLFPSRSMDKSEDDPAPYTRNIFLTPNEAMALAAWLSDASELAMSRSIRRKERAAETAARRAAKKAAKKAGEEGGKK